MTVTTHNKLEISVCMGSSCFSRGNADLISSLQALIEKHKLQDQILLRGNLCENICEKGPNVKLHGCLCESTEDRYSECLKAISKHTGIPVEKLL